MRQIYMLEPTGWYQYDIYKRFLFFFGKKIGEAKVSLNGKEIRLFFHTDKWLVHKDTIAKNVSTYHASREKTKEVE